MTNYKLKIMIEKNIAEFKKEDDIKQDVLSESIENIEGKIYLPYDVLKQYEFCAYQIYLQFIKNIKTQINESHGRSIQHQLENIFKSEAEEITLNEALELSKTQSVMTRDCFLKSDNYGIKGHVDEIWFKEDEIVLINDAQGRTPFDSTMLPIKAACLEFCDNIGDERKVKAALRERGTENLFWIEIITPEIKKDVENTLNEIHELIENKKEYIPEEDIKKCMKCEFKNLCDYSKVK